MAGHNNIVSFPVGLAIKSLLIYQLLVVSCQFCVASGASAAAVVDADDVTATAATVEPKDRELVGIDLGKLKGLLSEHIRLKKKNIEKDREVLEKDEDLEEKLEERSDKLQKLVNVETKLEKRKRVKVDDEDVHALSKKKPRLSKEEVERLVEEKEKEVEDLDELASELKKEEELEDRSVPIEVVDIKREEEEEEENAANAILGDKGGKALEDNIIKNIMGSSQEDVDPLMETGRKKFNREAISEEVARKKSSIPVSKKRSQIFSASAAIDALLAKIKLKDEELREHGAMKIQNSFRSGVLRNQGKNMKSMDDYGNAEAMTGKTQSNIGLKEELQKVREKQLERKQMEQEENLLDRIKSKEQEALLKRKQMKEKKIYQKKKLSHPKNLLDETYKKRENFLKKQEMEDLMNKKKLQDHQDQLQLRQELKKQEEEELTRKKLKEHKEQLQRQELLKKQEEEELTRKELKEHDDEVDSFVRKLKEKIGIKEQELEEQADDLVRRRKIMAAKEAGKEKFSALLKTLNESEGRVKVKSGREMDVIKKEKLSEAKEREREKSDKFIEEDNAQLKRNIGAEKEKEEKDKFVEEEKVPLKSKIVGETREGKNKMAVDEEESEVLKLIHGLVQKKLAEIEEEKRLLREKETISQAEPINLSKLPTKGTPAEEMESSADLLPKSATKLLAKLLLGPLKEKSHVPYESNSEKCQCGLRGETRNLNRDPWIVDVEVRSHHQPPASCYGTLLNHRYVLTAAHCLCGRVRGRRTLCGNGGNDGGNGGSSGIFNIYPTTDVQIDAYVGGGEAGASRSRHAGIQVIVPGAWLKTDTKNFDYGLLKVDPVVAFASDRRPVCLDGALPEGRNERAEPGHIYRAGSGAGAGAGAGVVEFVGGRQEVPLAGHRKSTATRRNKCVTDEKLPKPYHYCAEPCRRTSQTPAAENAFCRRFMKRLQQLRSEGDGDDRTTVRVLTPPDAADNEVQTIFEGEAMVVVEEDGGRKDDEEAEKNRTRICYQTGPGPHGWCRVQRMYPTTLDYSGGTDWGYCSPACDGVDKVRLGDAGRVGDGNIETNNMQAGKHKILDLDECRRLDSFDSRTEFCAGDVGVGVVALRRKASLSRFTWRRGHKPVRQKSRKEDLIKFLGVMGTCKSGRTGGPAVQWTNGRRHGERRAIQIGILARGQECRGLAGHGSALRPAIFTKVGIRRAWIMEHIVDGGCATFV